MTKLAAAIFTVATAFLFVASVALAGGDKVHGEKAQGEAAQHCVHPDESGSCPFED